MQTYIRSAPAGGDRATPTVGVISEWGIILEPGGWPVAGLNQLATLDDLGEFATWFDLKQIWIHRHALAALGLPHALPKLDGGAGWAHPWVEGTSWQMRTDPPGLRPWTTLWRDQPEKRRWELCVPSWDPDSPFRGVRSADELAGALDRFERATGVLWRVNGAWTSDRLLAGLHQGRGRNPILVSEHPPPAVEGNPPAGNEPQFSWWRELTRAERGATWCHIFDKHAMFLAATTNLELGVGHVVYSPGPPAPSERGHARPPGYYRIRRPDPGPDTWPDPFRPTMSRFLDDADGTLWVTLPTLHFAGDVEILEAWTWPKHSQFFNGWYKRLTEARKVSAGDELVQTAVKAIYQKGIGFLARKDGPGKPTYQPYWRHAVNAVARLNVWRNLTGLAAPPALVHFDEGWYFTKMADPYRLAARLGLKMGDGSGQWAPKGSLPGPVARQLLAEAKTPGGAQSASVDYLKQSREG